MRIIEIQIMEYNGPDAKEYLTNIAYDSVIFGFDNKKLKILILEYRNTGWYALPGGFVRKNENLNDAVIRGLFERTGISDIYLEQFYTFGSISRYVPAVMQTILEAHGFNITDDHWLLDRFISVGYYALINYNQVKLNPDELSDSIDWYDLEDLPELILDHNLIVDKAFGQLRSDLYYKPIGKTLLPELFTMKELQHLHEAILGETLNRTAFQRKILSLDILNRHEKLYSGKAHKAPYLYSFKN